jgi:aminoglycoside phosphotransferase (APT) family kinase protein
MTDPTLVGHDVLNRFLCSAAGADAFTITSSRRLSGGAIQENWLIEAQVDGGPWNGTLAAVLRTDAPSGVAASHSRAHEFTLLSTAFGAGVTVPEPLWLCQDREVLGRDFFVMRRIEGTAAGHLLAKSGPLGGDRVALARTLGEQLARIHAIAPGPVLAFLAPLPEGRPALQQVARARAFLDNHHTPHAALEWGLRWLEREAPPRGEIVLCHRDYRTGNYMVDEQGLTGILDWEFTGWGDPLEDIGWFCAKCWRFGRNEREAGGIGMREDFYAGYEAVSGRTIAREQVAYWEVMAHLNWAIIAIQQAERHLSGEEVSLNLALTGAIVPELEWEILTMTEQS